MKEWTPRHGDRPDCWFAGEPCDEHGSQRGLTVREAVNGIQAFFDRLRGKGKN